MTFNMINDRFLNYLNDLLQFFFSLLLLVDKFRQVNNQVLCFLEIIQSHDCLHFARLALHMVSTLLHCHLHSGLHILSQLLWYLCLQSYRKMFSQFANQNILQNQSLIFMPLLKYIIPQITYLLTQLALNVVLHLLLQVQVLCAHL